MGWFSRDDSRLTMHGSRSERRLLTQQRGRAGGRRDNRGALGPSSRHGRPTPKNPGRGGDKSSFWSW